MKTNNKSNEDDDGKRNDKIIKDLPSAMYSVRRATQYWWWNRVSDDKGGNGDHGDGNKIW